MNTRRMLIAMALSVASSAWAAGEVVKPYLVVRDGGIAKDQEKVGASDALGTSASPISKVTKAVEIPLRLSGQVLSISPKEGITLEPGDVVLIQKDTGQVVAVACRRSQDGYAGCIDKVLRDFLPTEVRN